MTHHNDNECLNDILQLLTEQGTDALAECVRILINKAMLIERSQALKALPYERVASRTGHANGFKAKTLLTRLAPITFDIPQTRGLKFYPNSLQKGLRSEQALNLALAEMYVQGVSTRKVSAIVEQLCGASVSSTHVSECAKLLDDQLARWRQRPLGPCPYLLLDARYEKVRQDGQLLDCAVLMAMGIGLDGKRTILGVSVALSEAEAHWRTFLQSLLQRGLCGVVHITSDDHAGLRAARAAVFPSVPWQRCQFHLQQNAQAHVPRVEMRAQVAQDIRTVFDSSTRPAAQARLKQVVAHYARRAPKLAAWMEENLPQGLTIFSLPPAHQKRLRTSNALERVNQEIKRRTRVARVFPNEASLLRLVSSILAEQSEEWESSKLYLNMKSATQPSV